MERSPDVPLSCLRLRQPEPPYDGRPPLLHLLCSCGDPAQPRGAQPTGASHAAGSASLCPQPGGRLAGAWAVGVRGGWVTSRMSGVVGIRRPRGAGHWREQGLPLGTRVTRGDVVGLEAAAQNGGH